MKPHIPTGQTARFKAHVRKRNSNSYEKKRKVA